jgi:hypothetical protein
MRTIGFDLAVQTAHKAVVLDERGHFYAWCELAGTALQSDS